MMQKYIFSLLKKIYFSLSNIIEKNISLLPEWKTKMDYEIQ